MESPKCQKIPSCGKRHYGDCDVKQEPRARKPGKSVGPKKKSKARGGEDSGVASRSTDGWPGSGISKPVFDEIMARLESLESRVGELESRKKYMREYQRARRAEEKGEG